MEEAWECPCLPVWVHINRVRVWDGDRGRRRGSVHVCQFGFISTVSVSGMVIGGGGAGESIFLLYIEMATCIPSLLSCQISTFTVTT